MKKINNSNMHIPEHREDLADLIIRKSRDIKQDESVILFYSFATKFKYGLSVFLILVASFFFGLNQNSNTYYQIQADQISVVEEIYYSNYNLL